MATNVAYGFVPRGEETQSIQSELLSTAHDYPTSSQQCTSSLTYNEAYITNTSPLERKEEFRANFHDANDVLDHVDYLG